MNNELSSPLFNQQLKLLQEVRANPKRFGAEPKKERNALVFKLREQNRKWKDVKKIVDSVHEPVSIERLYQIWHKEKMRELLGLGYIPEVSRKVDLHV